MSSLWIAVVALAVVPDDGSSLAEVYSAAALQQEQPLVPPRTGPELRDAVRANMQRWARVGGKEAHLAARAFLMLHDELQADDQLARAERERLGTKIRSRLLKLAELIRKQAAIEKRLARSGHPKSVDAAAATGGVLAQFGGFGPQGAFGGGFGPQGGVAMPGFAGRGLGGGMFGGGRYRYDHGPELVDLIQQVIAPDTWDVNGGLGSIYYWRPGRAMVIRQTGDVHDQVGGLLEQMGRMGR